MRLADKANDFKYQFYKVEGVGFGKQKPGSKRWDGILGELIDHVSLLYLQKKISSSTAKIIKQV